MKDLYQKYIKETYSGKLLLEKHKVVEAITDSWLEIRESY